MKQILQQKTALLALILSTGAFAATQPAVLKVDSKTSEVTWLGSKKVGDSHNGTIAVKSGTLEVAGDQLVGGTVELDMSTITSTDIKDTDMKQKLEGHLKSDDFFAVEKNPTTTFKITKVEPLTKGSKEKGTHKITGDLTLRGVTKPISFPATVSVKDSKVVATADKIQVNRTLFDVKFGSSNFFKELVANKVINDNIEIGLNLQAKK